MSNTNKNEEKKNGDVEIKQLEHSEVEIHGEIPADEFEKFREKAVKSFAEKVEIDGFRKGHVPENILEEKFGQVAIMEEMAQRAISMKYPEILTEHKIDAIGRPEVSITKLDKGSPLGFKIKTAVLPEIKLPDYKKIAKENTSKEEKIEVTDKEIDDVITHIRKQRAKNNQSETESTEEQSKENNKEKNTEKEEELPELTDETAKELGFDGLEDLKSIIRDNLRSEKETQEKDKKRAALLDALADNTEIDLPNLVVENELERMMTQLKGEISNMGLTFEDYLKHVGKSEEDLREASRPDAEKRAKSQLIINKIATVEDIEPEKDAIEKEVKNLTEKYQDADPERARAYVEMVLTNELVLKFLEGEDQSKKPESSEKEKKKEAS